MPNLAGNPIVGRKYKAACLERFHDRSRILRDGGLSHAAARLYLLLDDELWGEDRGAVTQHSMAKLLGVGDRQIRRVIGELETRAYLRKDHRMSGNVYEFIRTKMSVSETDIRTKMSARTGQKCPAVPYMQEATSSKALRSEYESQNLLVNVGACQSCRGSGRVMIPAIGWSSCTPCRGTGKRRAVA